MPLSKYHHSSNDVLSERDKRLHAPPDFNGPSSNRKCTDILFALILLIMWGAMTALGAYTWQNGDYRNVIYPMDYDGNICGTSKGEIDMTEYPKIFYVNNFAGGVCLKECPKVRDVQLQTNGTEQVNVTTLIDVHTLITYSGVYQGDGAWLDADFVQIADYSTSNYTIACTEETCDTDPNTSWSSEGINGGFGFAWYAVDSFEILGTRCVSNPNAVEELKSIVTNSTSDLSDNENLNEAQLFFAHLYGDVYEARWFILGFGIGVAMVIGFLYAQLLRVELILGFMIWGSILATIAVIIGTGYYAYEISNEWDAADPQVKSDFDIRAAKVFSYILFALGGIAFLVTIFLRKQIMLSMACVRAAARSIAAIPTMVVFPIIQILGLFAFLAIWIFYAVHLASMGDIKTETFDDFTVPVTVRTFEFDKTTTNQGWYLLFCLLWTAAFVSAIGEIIIAMCVSKWYFTRDKKQIGSSTLFSSIKQSMRYHIGTAALGSFVIASVQLIRWMIAKAQKKARELDNKVGQTLLCCCQCCLWCFEKVLKFLNKNAYIQTAIFGTPFCRSAREAFSLIIRNAGKVASITYVSSLILFVGKIFVSSVTTGSAYMYMDYELGASLYSPAGPCVIIFVMSYFIGNMFLDVFDMSTSTVLQCFIADEEMFDGDECYADGDLRRWLDDFDEEERRIVASSGKR